MQAAQHLCGRPEALEVLGEQVRRGDVGNVLGLWVWITGGKFDGVADPTGDDQKI